MSIMSKQVKHINKGHFILFLSFFNTFVFCCTNSLEVYNMTSGQLQPHFHVCFWNGIMPDYVIDASVLRLTVKFGLKTRWSQSMVKLTVTNKHCRLHFQITGPKKFVGFRKTSWFWLKKTAYSQYQQLASHGTKTLVNVGETPSN